MGESEECRVCKKPCPDSKKWKFIKKDVLNFMAEYLEQ